MAMNGHPAELFVHTPGWRPMNQRKTTRNDRKQGTTLHDNQALFENVGSYEEHMNWALRFANESKPSFWAILLRPT